MSAADEFPPLPEASPSRVSGVFGRGPENEKGRSPGIGNRPCDASSHSGGQAAFFFQVRLGALVTNPFLIALVATRMRFT